MDSREQVNLSDVLQKKGYIRGPFGSALKRGDMKETGIPVYEQQHAIYNHRNFRYFIDDEKFNEMQRFQVQTNDLIISCSGTVGKVSIINEEDPKGIISQALLLLRANTDKILPEYLRYFFTSSEGYNAIVSRSSGSVQVNISKRNVIEQIPLSLPTLATQKKIVDILGDIDKKIKTNEMINENLLQQALAIYKAWFCDYVLSDGALPESWHITTIDELSSLVTRGIAPKYDDSSNQIVLNQKCIRDHTIDVSLARRHLPKKINEKWISKGDLLINSTGTGTLGRVAQVWFDANNMTVDSHVTIVRPKAPILQSYIGFWGLSHESEIEAQHTGSTGQTELPRDRVKAMELILPDGDTLSNFNELVIPMTDAVVSNQKENAQLSQLRDTLLPKLMSSKIDVSELEL